MPVAAVMPAAVMFYTWALAASAFRPASAARRARATAPRAWREDWRRASAPRARSEDSVRDEIAQRNEATADDRAPTSSSYQPAAPEPSPLGLAALLAERALQAAADLGESLSGGSPAAPAERVVVLGSGWGAAALVAALGERGAKTTVVSPRNYLLFTPMLAGASVGTVDTRAAVARPRSPTKSGGVGKSRIRGRRRGSTGTCSRSGVRVASGGRGDAAGRRSDAAGRRSDAAERRMSQRGRRMSRRRRGETEDRGGRRNITAPTRSRRQVPDALHHLRHARDAVPGELRRRRGLEGRGLSRVAPRVQQARRIIRLKRGRRPVVLRGHPLPLQPGLFRSGLGRGPLFNRAALRAVVVLGRRAVGDAVRAAASPRGLRAERRLSATGESRPAPEARASGPASLVARTRPLSENPAPRTKAAGERVGGSFEGGRRQVSQAWRSSRE